VTRRTAGLLTGGLLAVIAVVVLVVVAFAGGDDSADQIATPEEVASGLDPEQQAQLEEFRSCMSEQGVELPEPGEGPAIQGPSPEMLEAMQQCQQYLPEGIGPGGGGAPGLRIQPPQ
jgi:hypothetical protein